MIEIGLWRFEFGPGDWNFGMVQWIWIGKWDWRLAFELGLGCIPFKFECLL